MPLYFSQGGIKYWVESAGTFAAKAYSLLVPKTTETNADAIISPKGNGALLAQVPDGLVSGGNARGLYAIDLQRERATANQVASGDYSNILSGGSNKASGYLASVLGGYGNTASGQGSVVLGSINNTVGSGNTASNTGSFVGTGQYNVSSGQYSTILNGAHHSITGNYSVICGGGTGTAGQGNTISGLNGFIGNGAINSVGASDNAILNGNKVTITASRNSFLGAGSASNSTDYVTISGSNNIVGGTSGNFVVSGSGNVLLGTMGHAGRVFAGNNSVVLGCNQPFITSGTQYCFTASSAFPNFSACKYAWQIGTTNNSGVSHDYAGVMGGEAATRTHHSQATGYAKAQRHVADFLYEGTTTANETVTAIAMPSSGVLTKDAKSVLTIPTNSVMIGKLNFSVKEAATANVLAWIDAQVTIYKGASTPIISINKVDTVGSITGVSLSVINSGTVTDGIEFQITSVSAKTLRAKATFEYDLIID